MKPEEMTARPRYTHHRSFHYFGQYYYADVGQDEKTYQFFGEVWGGSGSGKHALNIKTDLFPTREHAYNALRQLVLEETKYHIE